MTAPRYYIALNQIPQAGPFLAASTAHGMISHVKAILGDSGPYELLSTPEWHHTPLGNNPHELERKAKNISLRAQGLPLDTYSWPDDTGMNRVYVTRNGEYISGPFKLRDAAIASLPYIKTILGDKLHYKIVTEDLWHETILGNVYEKIERYALKMERKAGLGVA